MMRQFLCSFLCASLLSAQTAAQPAAPDPQWDRLYPNAAVLEMMRGYERAYPGWVKVESLGKTSAGGDTWLITITNPKTGSAESKPGVYIDGSTHANEIQGTETTLYTVNFVLKNYGKLPRVTEFLDRATLYVIPMMNVDSRERWFSQPSTPNFPRTLPVPIDDDRDGLMDEDGFDDLNGDGEITMMRKKVPLGRGNFKLHPKDSRLLVPVAQNELGDYVMLGFEGSDNDGDGQVNEDPYGYVDPNRVWGEGFQPRYVQAGASEYPLQYPEARNIAEWMGACPVPEAKSPCRKWICASMIFWAKRVKRCCPATATFGSRLFWATATAALPITPMAASEPLVSVLNSMRPSRISTTTRTSHRTR
jgi:hypothetical protein